MSAAVDRWNLRRLARHFQKPYMKIPAEKGASARRRADILKSDLYSQSFQQIE